MERRSPTLDRILGELSDIAGRTDEADLERVADRILSADRVYVTGMGRSGLMARSFAMRLMHLGLSVFVVGETTTPSIEEGDLLVCCSRFGRSGSVLHYMGKAHTAGATAAVITMDPKSPLAEQAEVVLGIPVGENDAGTRQPLGTLFEQLLLLTLDALVIILMRKRDFTEGEMQMLHTNLE